MQQEQPSTLEILHTWDPAQQNFMFSDGAVEMRCNKLWVPQWRTEQLDALFVWWQRRPSPHSGSCIGLPGQPFELTARLRTDVATVPNFGLAFMDVDPCMPEELDSQCRVPDANPLQPRCHVNVIHKSKYFLVWHSALNCFQSWVLS